MLSQLYDALIAGKQKAIAGFVVAWVATFVLQHFGVHVSDAFQMVAISTIAAALTHASVYFTTNK